MRRPLRLTAVAALVAVLLGSCSGTGDPAPERSPSTVAQRDAALRDAAWAGDVEGARRLVAAGADVNAKDDTQQSAYLISTSEGPFDLLEVMLAGGGDVRAKDSWNGTGLIRAAERGLYLVTGRLLTAGVEKDHVNRIGYQAIHEAVWFGADAAAELATVRVLVAGGVQLDRPSGAERMTALKMAQHKGFQRLEQALTAAQNHRRSADPDASLLAAASAGDADAVALALRDGAGIETRDDRRRTALLLASAGDHVDVARVLVAMGADPDALDVQHDTPWLVTGVTGSVEMLETLLPARPDLTIVNRFGGVSVIPAAERGHVDYVRRVVTTGIDIDHVNQLGWTALLEAVILGDGGERHQQIVQILLAAGADRSIADKAGVTALQHAEQKGHQAIAALLRAG